MFVFLLMCYNKGSFFNEFALKKYFFCLFKEHCNLMYSWSMQQDL